MNTFAISAPCQSWSGMGTRSGTDAGEGSSGCPDGAASCCFAGAGRRLSATCRIRFIYPHAAGGRLQIDVEHGRLAGVTTASGESGQ